MINLCAATSPVGLGPPDHAGLKRYSFFVSRRLEEGRERFRLHMGYFATQEEAERLLDIVREIYPAAWAGLAPGQRLRTQALPAALPGRPTAAATEAAEPPAAAEPPVAPELTLVPDAGRGQAPQFDLVDLVDSERVDSAPVDPEQDGAATVLSNVRAAIASLEDNAGDAPNGSTEINDAAALRVLEPGGAAALPPVIQQRPSFVPQPPSSVQSSPPPHDERAAFAVQLLWSVQPIDLAKIPRLAIFSAYTLYGAEGNRDGRRWYGVRLGFFTDAVSAKQVAHYVRSDFSTVSVVPVTVRERERAKLAALRPIATPVGAPAGKSTGASPVKPAASEFVFIEDKEPESGLRSGAARTPSGPPGKRAKLRPGRQGAARTRTKPISLEETLEILGAGALAVDDGRGTRIKGTDAKSSGADHAKAKSSRIGRLLERLSERLG